MVFVPVIAIVLVIATINLEQRLEFRLSQITNLSLLPRQKNVLLSSIRLFLPLFLQRIDQDNHPFSLPFTTIKGPNSRTHKHNSPPRNRGTRTPQWRIRTAAIQNLKLSYLIRCFSIKKGSVKTIIQSIWPLPGTRKGVVVVQRRVLHRRESHRWSRIRNPSTRI